jgi:DNA-binding transcriptional LysR family regulator
MELRHLRYFAAVARAGTYRAAADRVRIAEPALWQQVQALQRELGVPLFEKAGRRVRLSRAGAVLLEHADRVLAAEDKLAAAAADLRSGRSGVIAIACYTPYIERFLAPVIGRFEQDHPDIRVDIEEFTATGGEVGAIPASTASLMAGTADLAVGPRPAGGTDGFLVDEARIVALISPAHKWAKRAAIPVTLLDGEPLLLSAARDSFSRSAVERACHRHEFEPVIKFQSRSSPTLAALAAHGVGVALLPDHAVPASFTGLIRPLHGADDLLRRESWLSWRTGTLTPPALHDFIEQARRQATALNPDTAHQPARPGHGHRA